MIDKDGIVTDTYVGKQTSFDKIFSREAANNESIWKAICRENLALEICGASDQVCTPVEFIRTRKNFYIIQELSNGGSL